MSDQRVFANQRSVAFASDDTWVAQRALRDGSAVMADWRMALVLEGRCFNVTVGAFSTPIVGGGNGTVIDIDQPELGVSFADGDAGIPLDVKIQVETPLIAADDDEVEALIAADVSAAYAGDGTVTTETPSNMLVGGGSSSATAFSAATADITDPVLGVELDRLTQVADVQGTAANALWGNFRLHYAPNTPIVLAGPSAVYGYWGGTVASSGFAQVIWAEFSELEVT